MISCFEEFDRDYLEHIYYKGVKAILTKEQKIIIFNTLWNLPKGSIKLIHAPRQYGKDFILAIFKVMQHNVLFNSNIFITYSPNMPDKVKKHIEELASDIEFRDISNEFIAFSTYSFHNPTSMMTLYLSSDFEFYEKPATIESFKVNNPCQTVHSYLGLSVYNKNISVPLLSYVNEFPVMKLDLDIKNKKCICRHIIQGPDCYDEDVLEKYKEILNSEDYRNGIALEPIFR